jgi:hypothetical protein
MPTLPPPLPAPPPPGGGPDLAGLKPLAGVRSRWPMVVGGLLTVAMIAGLAHQLSGAGLDGLAQSIPTSPLFYLAFAALYATPVLFDYLIFRRLWGIPLAGLVALAKKRIANDVLLGYSGEAYFYAWARARATMVAAPFGAVKDVSILSAVAGNAITLAMVVLALPFAASLLTPLQFKEALGGAAIMLGTSLPFLIFSRRVFSLERGQLWWIFAMHCLRVVGAAVLVALTWHFALPAVGIAMWLVLAAAKQLVSRLPLVPNKDLLFANLAVLLIGRHAPVAHLIAIVTAGTLLVHLVLIVLFSLGHVAQVRKRA